MLVCEAIKQYLLLLKVIPSSLLYCMHAGLLAWLVICFDALGSKVKCNSLKTLSLCVCAKLTEDHSAD